MKIIHIALLGFLFTSASCDDAANEVNPNENDQMVKQINEFPIEPLNDSEGAALIFMREEEKLARDVYDFLFAQWNSISFDNISSSEQTHMDAVLALINKYELEDPAKNDIPGKFVNSDLQMLYNDLIEKGNLSQVDAFKVGAAIEEIDILDLQRELDTNVDNEDIIFTFENLLRGSRNHLRSFVQNLSKLGIDYKPQYLTQEAYDEIVNADMEQGRGARKGKGRNN
jgi:hypothetical protein